MSKGAFKSQYFFFVKKGACARPFERQELGSSTKEARSASKLGSTLNQDHNSIFLWYSILLFLEFIVLHVKADDIPQNVNSFRMPKCVHSYAAFRFAARWSSKQKCLPFGEHISQLMHASEPIDSTTVYLLGNSTPKCTLVSFKLYY